MDPRDTAPDSWELEEDAEAPAAAAGLPTAFAALNVNAKPFVPNVNAPVFVPSFLQASAVEMPASDGRLNARQCREIDDRRTDHVSDPFLFKCFVLFFIHFFMELFVSQLAIQENKNTELSHLLQQPKPLDVSDVHWAARFVNVSSLCALIERYLTGMVDKRTLEKYEREAKEKNRETWYLSWALDTNQEERDKGKTVEVGRAYFETEKKHFTILDAPGHKSFVPNMIGGASQADLAVLVISARKGEFETGFEKGGQTREHAMLAKTAGVKHLIVLINKMDDPTVNWSLERYEECKEKLVPFLKKVGFNPKKDIHFMPCSGLTGANLKDPVPECPWYTGLPFIAHLDSLPNFTRSSDGPVRLPIVDKYKDMGTVILGKLESGSISKAQQLVMMPNRHTVEVLSLLSDDVETDDASPGENLKLRLKGIEEEEILPGFILCSPDNLCHSGRTFDAQIVIIEHKSIICPGYNAVLHIHTCIEEVQITALICLVDKKTGEKSKTRPRFVKQDQVCIARLRAAGVICLETFKDFPQMGRFTLRDEGKTIAIGKVLKLVPEKD
uniref:DNA meiotic recombinase 1 n=1 Tax=Oreochromis niloticus TaxID=8128 RepID=A0A669EHX7_ORENI